MVALLMDGWLHMGDLLLGARSCKLVNAAKLFRTVRRLAKTSEGPSFSNSSATRRWQKELEVSLGEKIYNDFTCLPFH